MRVTLEIQNKNITESGLMLIDKEGNTYHWITKQYNHPLFFTHDWVIARMTITDDVWGTGKNVKNVMLVEKNT